MSGAALARAAIDLVGTRYRLHGRDPATGLDCIGLFAAAMAAIGRPVRLPSGYPLRARTPPLALEAVAAAAGLTATSRTPLAGDILFVRPGPCQFHLLVACGDACIVHAHAGLRRVALGHLRSEWRVARHWRLADEH